MDRILSLVGERPQEDNNIYIYVPHDAISISPILALKKREEASRLLYLERRTSKKKQSAAER